MIKNSQNTGRDSINGMCKVVKVGEVEEDPSRISRLSKWMISLTREYKRKNRMK